MQTLKDAMVLLGVVLVLVSVRVSRVEPVSLDLIPAVQAATAEPAVGAPAIEPSAILPAEIAIGAPSWEARGAGSCETQVFRFRTSPGPGGEVIAIAVEKAKQKTSPRACKIG
jgi:hypothetical protein